MIPRNLLLLVLLLSLGPASSFADGRSRHRDPQDTGWDPGYRERSDPRDDSPGEKRREISLNEAVQMVQRRYNARVVRAESLRDGDRTIYRLRLLSQDGRVWTVTVDASSGAVR